MRYFSFCLSNSLIVGDEKFSDLLSEAFPLMRPECLLFSSEEPAPLHQHQEPHLPRSWQVKYFLNLVTLWLSSSYLLYRLTCHQISGQFLISAFTLFLEFRDSLNYYSDPGWGIMKLCIKCLESFQSKYKSNVYHL